MTDAIILMLLGKPKGWTIAYYDHGSVVVQSPTGYRERYRI